MLLDLCTKILRNRAEHDSDFVVVVSAFHVGSDCGVEDQRLGTAISLEDALAVANKFVAELHAKLLARGFAVRLVDAAHAF